MDFAPFFVFVITSFFVIYLIKFGARFFSDGGRLKHSLPKNIQKAVPRNLLNIKSKKVEVPYFKFSVYFVILLSSLILLIPWSMYAHKGELISSGIIFFLVSFSVVYIFIFVSKNYKWK